MDELTQYILNGASHASISPSMLELLGQKASNMFLENGIGLNDGVVKVASIYPDINHEQLKRICEFANTATYLSIHDKSKVSRAQYSYPQFELADPLQVIQDISESSNPSVTPLADSSYGRAPFRLQTNSSSITEDALKGLFKTSEVELDFSRDTAVKELMTAKTDLVGLKDHLIDMGESFDLNYKTASAELYEAVKRHVLDDGSFTDILAAANSTGASKDKIAEVVQPIVERLIKEKVASPRLLRSEVKQMTKVAHRIVDQKHPFVQTFKEVLACSNEINTIENGIAQVEKELVKVNDCIRNEFLRKNN